MTKRPEAINLVQPDNYRRGVYATPQQQLYDEIVYAGLAPFQIRENNKDLPHAAMAVVGNFHENPNLGRKVRCELQRTQSVYASDQLATLSVTRIPAAALRRRRETPPRRNEKPLRLNMLEQEFYMTGNNFLRIGGPVQPRKPRQYRADTSPLVNLPRMTEEHWSPTTEEPRRILQAPAYGEVSLVVTQQTKGPDKGKPYHFNVLIRNGGRDEIAFQFVADEMDGVEVLVSETDEHGQKRIVQKRENLVALTKPVRYAWRHYGPKYGKLVALDMRDVEIKDGKKIHGAGEMIRVSDRPEYVEILCRLMENVFEHANRGLPTLPVQSWAPQHMLELPMDLWEVFDLVCRDNVLGSTAFQRDMLIGLWRGQLTAELPGLRDAAKAKVAEFGPQIATISDLEHGLEDCFWDVARAWFQQRVISSGRHGYEGNGVLLPWDLASRHLRSRAGDHHIFWPTWEQGFHDDLKAFLAPAMFHRTWNAPLVLGTLPDVDAKAEGWGEDFDQLKRIAREDSFAWQLGGIFWSFRPANGTVAMHRVTGQAPEPRPRKGTFKPKELAKEMAAQVAETAMVTEVAEVSVEAVLQ